MFNAILWTVCYVTEHLKMYVLILQLLTYLLPEEFVEGYEMLEIIQVYS